METFLVALGVMFALPVILAKIVLSLSTDELEKILRKHHDEYGEFNYSKAAEEIWLKNWL